MHSEPYLQHLTSRLVDAVDRLPLELRRRHAAWIAQRQNPDGGFSGREGGSDLYYTGFALRALAVLQELDGSVCDRAAGFLRERLTQPANVVDLFSLVVSTFLVQLGGGPDVLAQAPPDWRTRLADTLEAHRHADGGYAKSPGGTSGSTYTTFLVALALELFSMPIPQPDRVIAFLHTRDRDGGFVEIPQMKRAGTNPTAAAIGTLQILDALGTSTRAATTLFLSRLVAPEEGGIRANDRIPTADLLSTFTGLWTLDDLGALERVDHIAMRRYAESLQGPSGGFRGGLWDAGMDVEYTFYGIGVLGLLADT
jgi:geranylgeranyl transferase type-2 subunit beta